MATRAESRAADEWWASPTDERRVSTHRWLTGLSKKAPAPDPLQMTLEEAIEEGEEGEG